MADTLRTESGAPGRRQPELPDRRPARPGAAPGPAPAREARALQPRADPGARRARGRLGRLRPLRGHEPRRRRAGRACACSRSRASAPRCSRASRPSPARRARPTPRATRAASRSSSTPRTATGTSPGNNTPIFFIRDPLKFPDFIHSQKYDPYTNEQEPENVWDFFSLEPRGHAPVHLAVRRPRHPGQLPPHGRLRLAHLPVGEREGRAVLGEVPLQDRPGHPLPHERGGRARSAARTRSTTSRTCAPRSSAASSRRGR